MRHLFQVPAVGMALIFLLTSFAAAEPAPALSGDGYAARWLLSAYEATDEMAEAEPTPSGSVNQPSESPDFDGRYPGYTPLGHYEWLGGWIREGAWAPITRGDRLAREGGAPYIVSREGSVPLSAEASGDAPALARFSRGQPVWVIGQWEQWLLCVREFTPWLYSDEPEPLACGWLPAGDALPLPPGLWDGSYDEAIEACHFVMEAPWEIPMYAQPSRKSGVRLTIPGNAQVDAYDCSINENWLVCWFNDSWGYIPRE